MRLRSVDVFFMVAKATAGGKEEHYFRSQIDRKPPTTSMATNCGPALAYENGGKFEPITIIG